MVLLGGHVDEEFIQMYWAWIVDERESRVSDVEE
jgi:hypothetical protein